NRDSVPLSGSAIRLPAQLPGAGGAAVLDPGSARFALVRGDNRPIQIVRVPQGLRGDKGLRSRNGASPRRQEASPARRWPSRQRPRRPRPARGGLLLVPGLEDEAGGAVF